MSAQTQGRRISVRDVPTRDGEQAPGRRVVVRLGHTEAVRQARDEVTERRRASPDRGGTRGAEETGAAVRAAL